MVYRYGDEEMTRTDLQALVLKLAGYFKELGIKKGDRVLFLLHDTPAFSASFLAAIWIGAVPVPITPRSKSDTLSYIIQDSETRFIIAEAESLPAIDEALGGKSRPKVIFQDLYIPSTPNIPKGVISLSKCHNSHETVECVESESQK
ncbi:MAG: AMP-binding protein [Pseudomonadota bacterium]